MQIDMGITAIFVSIIIALLAFAFGYGILTQKVKGNSTAISEEKKKYEVIDSKLDSLCITVKKIETLVQRNGDR